MDVSHLLSDNITTWIDIDEAKVNIKYLTSADRAAIRREMITVTDDVLQVNVTAYDLAVCVAAVIGWEGFTAHGEPIPCTPENVRKVARWADFADAVAAACFKLDSFRTQAIDEEKKS